MVSNRRMSRIAAITLTAGLALTGFAAPANAQDVSGIVKNVSDAISEAVDSVIPDGSNTAKHE